MGAFGCMKRCFSACGLPPVVITVELCRIVCEATLPPADPQCWYWIWFSQRSHLQRRPCCAYDSVHVRFQKENVKSFQQSVQHDTTVERSFIAVGFDKIVPSPSLCFLASAGASASLIMPPKRSLAASRGAAKRMETLMAKIRTLGHIPRESSAHGTESRLAHRWRRALLRKILL